MHCVPSRKLHSGRPLGGRHPGTDRCLRIQRRTTERSETTTARPAVTSHSARSRVVSCICGARDGMPMWTRSFARLRHRELSRCHGILRSAPRPGAIAMPWDSSLGSATGAIAMPWDSSLGSASLRMTERAVILRSPAAGGTTKDLMQLVTSRHPVCARPCPERSEGPLAWDSSLGSATGAIAMPWDSSLGSATGGYRGAMGFFARLRHRELSRCHGILRSAPPRSE